MHLITQVLLQKRATAVHLVTTVMPLLYHQTKTGRKVGTPEKNFANVKTVENICIPALVKV